jgi:magnesium transporter
LISVFRDPENRFRDSGAKELPEEIIWIDLLNPTDEEKATVARRTGIRVPSLDALSEIEASSRLAVDDGVIYLTTPVVAHGDGSDASLSSIGFILTKSFLVTVRFADLPAFNSVVDLVRHDDKVRNSSGVFIALLEAFVDVGADVLERLGGDLDKVSRSVFRGDPTRRQHTVRSNRSLRRVLSTVGTVGDRLSLARDTLLGLGRIAQFVETLEQPWIAQDCKVRLGAIARDIVSLNDFEGHLSNKVQFLLDAVLGFISIEQNDLFKVLTIVSVVGIPPTLIAGIYGMNFKFMPELSWVWGYPFGLAAIALSAVIPLVWFKWKGWI